MSKTYSNQNNNYINQKNQKNQKRIMKTVLQAIETAFESSENINNERNIVLQYLMNLAIPVDNLIKPNTHNENLFTNILNQLNIVNKHINVIKKEINKCNIRLDLIKSNMNKLSEQEQICLYDKYKYLLMSITTAYDIPFELTQMINVLSNKLLLISDKYVVINYEHGIKYIKKFASEEVVEHCVTKIDELKGKNDFYIGATNNPEARMREHLTTKFMSKMYVLCAVSNKKAASFLESTLIRKFCHDKNILNKCLTFKGNYNFSGGEGLMSNYNCVYLLC